MRTFATSTKQSEKKEGYVWKDSGKKRATDSVTTGTRSKCDLLPLSHSLPLISDWLYLLGYGLGLIYFFLTPKPKTFSQDPKIETS